jgi:hypothetical protein
MNDVYALDLDGNDAQWSLQPCVSSSAPEPRWRHIGAAINDETMLVFGGIGNQSKRFNDVWVLDVSLEIPAWTENTPTGTRPCPKAHHSGTMVGNQVR